LDVHLEFCEVAIAEQGEVRSAGRIETRPEQIELFAQSLGKDDRVALEVTGNAWEIARIIAPHVAQVLVVSPNDTGIRQARAKTDRLDARTLARLLASGELDAVWMPDRRIQVMRRRLQRRGQLVWGRARAKNQIHATLMRCLIGRAPFADLFGKKGRRWLAELELPAEERESVDSALRQIEFLDSEIAAVERLIATDALESPEIKRLMTVPGVNVICAATFIAAIGDIGGSRARASWSATSASIRASSSRGQARRRTGGSRSRARSGPATRSSRLAGASSASPGRSTPSMRVFALGVGTRSRWSRRPQARLPVLVPAQPRGGLRLPAALADAEEAAPARDPRRHADAQGHRHRSLGDPAEDARSRTHARESGRSRLQAHRRRLAVHPGEEEGRRRDTGARISWPVKRASSATGHSPKSCALARRQDRRPFRTLANRRRRVQRSLDFHASSGASVCGSVVDALAFRPKAAKRLLRPEPARRRRCATDLCRVALRVGCRLRRQGTPSASTGSHAVLGGVRTDGCVARPPVHARTFGLYSPATRGVRLCP